MSLSGEKELAWKRALTFASAALAYLAWGYAISKAEKTAHVTVFSYLIPFISALLGYLWLHETLTAPALIGGIVIIAGMVMTSMRR